MADKLRTLYRPVGLGEMIKILDAGARGFPQRRPEQPIFYPVLNRAYAQQIAEKWNAPHAATGYAGFVTEFRLDAQYARRFKSHVVGSSVHRELWVPAEQLEEFNQHLVGPITVVDAFYGEQYVGPSPRPLMLKGRTAREQLPLLERILDYNAMDFLLEVQVQRVVVQLNFAYWVRANLTADGLPLPRKVKILRDVRTVRDNAFPESKLVGSDELDALAGQVDGAE